MDLFSHSPVLFVGRDGTAMEFYSLYTGEDKAVIKSMIEYGSGIFHSNEVESAVCLVELGDNSVQKDVKQVTVSMNFIWDCVEQNELLEIKRYVLTAPEPFRKQEDRIIIKCVLRHAECPRMSVNEFYHSFSEEGILNRDSYSIKSRAKRLYYEIETYNMSESDQKKFKSVIKPALMYGSYCETDDYVILSFLSSRISRVHEKEVYDEMEKEEILNYSSKSLLYRALKLILPNIDLYDVSTEFKASVKSHLSQVYNIHSKSTLEDHVIIRYLQGNIKHMRNITVYKKMEEKKVLNRSAEYMQLRFLYHILPNIDSYNISPYFKKRFKNADFDGFSIFYDDSSVAHRSRRYTKDEDYIIINFLEEKEANPFILATYQELEKEQILNRTAASLRGRFRTWIMLNIDSYDIPPGLKLHLKGQNAENRSRHMRLKADKYLTSLPSSVGGSLGPVSEVCVPTNVDIRCPSQRPSDRKLMAAGLPCTESSSSRPGKSGDSWFAGVARKRRKKCVPLPDSDSDSIVAESSVTKSSVKPAEETSNRNKGCSKGIKPKKQTATREEKKSTYAGDLFSYFLSQRSLSDDGVDISAFLSQNSLVTSTTGGAKPSSVDSPCFLQAILDHCQARPDDDDEEEEEEEEDSDTEVSSRHGREEHFPVDMKMKFMSRAIALLQNIEQNDLFQECVKDSLFYQKLVFKIYRINGTVYKNFLEKEVSNIMKKKSKLNLTDKVFLMKYLSCHEKISPENPMEIFSRFNLR